MKQFKIAFRKNQNIESIVFKLNSITSGFKICMNTGNWGVQNSIYKKIGVSQVLNRLTQASMVSHLRRITSSAGKDGKLTKLRQVHPSQWGIICPVETPEGSSCGIVKNFSLLTRVTIDSDPYLVFQYCMQLEDVHDVAQFECSDFATSTFVFLNGNLFAYTKCPAKVVDALCMAREIHILGREVSIAHCHMNKKISIYTEGGRCVRPVFHVKRLSQISLDEFRAKSWTELEYMGVIAYLDKSEESTIITDYDLLERRPFFGQTFCDIDPAMILGVAGSCIPYPEHNQAPRNCYQASMGKQAIGVYCSNERNRLDVVSHVLLNAQAPIVNTIGSKIVRLNELPAGQNVIVAVACYQGYNQEDSVIMNQSSIDRGMFMCISYKTLVCEEKKTSSNLIELFGVPREEIRQVNKNYHLLDEEGIVPIGTFVTAGDVLVGKILHKGDDTKMDMSLVVKQSEEGVVERVVIVNNEDGLKCVKIKIRQMRIPEMGDKVASRAAQKGTIGLTVQQHDMPFSSSGIVPDIIINPHCMPSRMTIGQLIECITGKVSSLEFCTADATPFRKATVEEISERLARHGFHRHGKERLFNGHTGEPIDTMIFMGPTYYQRLKHMVLDKIHARSHGNIQLLTRQPLEGRSRDGGLRFGEMERDAMIAHGNSAFLKDRLLDQSDAHTANLCTQCGLIGSDLCQNCGSMDFCKINMPYATNIFTQELEAIGMSIRFQAK